MPEYKKYDSEDEYTCMGVRLAKDADVKETDTGNIVTLTFVSTSRNEADSDLWVEAKIADRQADLAGYLQKDDILHAVRGKPTIRKWNNKEGQEKVSFQLRRASLVLPLGMFATVKGRGWEPGGARQENTTSRSKPTKGRTSKPAPSIDDDIPF